MTLLATFCLVLAVMPNNGRQPAILRWIWEKRGSWAAKILYAMNLVALGIVCLKVSPSSVVLQKYIYDHYPEGCQVCVLGEKSPYENVSAQYVFLSPGTRISALRNLRGRGSSSTPFSKTARAISSSSPIDNRRRSASTLACLQLRCNRCTAPTRSGWSRTTISIGNVARNFSAFRK